MKPEFVLSWIVQLAALLGLFLLAYRYDGLLLEAFGMLAGGVLGVQVYRHYQSTKAAPPVIKVVVPTAKIKKIIKGEK